MGRPKGGNNEIHSKEEKLALVKRKLNGATTASLESETGIYRSQIHKWTKQYLEGGEAALVNKRKPGNPLAKYRNRKELTRMEMLLLNLSLVDSKMFCVVDSDIGIAMTSKRSLMKLSTILTTSDRFANLKENRQSNTALNWQLNSFFVSTNY